MEENLKSKSHPAQNRKWQSYKAEGLQDLGGKMVRYRSNQPLWKIMIWVRKEVYRKIDVKMLRLLS